MQARFRTYIIFEIRYFLFQKVVTDFIVFDHTGNLHFLYSIGYREGKKNYFQSRRKMVHSGLQALMEPHYSYMLFNAASFKIDLLL